VCRKKLALKNSDSNRDAQHDGTKHDVDKAKRITFPDQGKQKDKSGSLTAREDRPRKSKDEARKKNTEIFTGLCHICQQKGHKAADCPKATKVSSFISELENASENLSSFEASLYPINHSSETILIIRIWLVRKTILIMKRKRFREFGRFFRTRLQL